ncbi:hypothetical protein [Pseudomonas protegens]|uniref:hypothetical protein n=1 Tax=Pseudomonas protegens TaxID=380021 RepID=UPI001A92F5C7|nr:hypothetical protein [Pseudomonas protegens]BCT30680.1 hypothetical protein PproGo58_01750 [Pseudomonas protegens]
MANEDPKALATILGFAEHYLQRPLTVVERQVLEAFIQNKSLDLAQGARQSVDQARQRASALMQADEQRTRQIIDQLSGAGATGKADPQVRELVLRQLLAAAEAENSNPALPPSANEASGPGSAGAEPVARAVSALDDPALKAMISALVQQEVKAAVEARMAELSQKVEDTLKQVLAAAGQ